ncbi:hypothetical protein [Streptomyces sp. NPDC056069]|uniref:MmyB family transcriptional regulator n=1 Tax=Streptomyces sp. NPDC056069 TaxID=3345702 RepID=UPI0035D59655
MTLSAAFVSNGRLDIVATHAVARAVLSPMFDSDTADDHGRPNCARYYFLDPGAQHVVADWGQAVTITTAPLRAEPGRYPNDKALRELIGELSTLSTEFRTRWAAHGVRIHHGGVKSFDHPDAGRVDGTLRRCKSARVSPYGRCRLRGEGGVAGGTRDRRRRPRLGGDVRRRATLPPTCPGNHMRNVAVRGTRKCMLAR